MLFSVAKKIYLKAKKKKKKHGRTEFLQIVRHAP